MIDQKAIKKEVRPANHESDSQICNGIDYTCNRITTQVVAPEHFLIKI